MTNHRFSSRGRLCAASVVLSIAAAHDIANAQRVTSSLDAQSTRLQYADTVRTTAAGLSPSVRLDWNRATLAAWGTYAQFGSAWSTDGSMSASLFTPSAGLVSLELVPTVGGSAHQDGTRTGMAVALGRMHVAGMRMGMWLGGGAGATWDGNAWRGLREGDVGAWTANDVASLTLTAQPTIVDDSIRYTDFGAHANWHPGIFELGAVAGTRAGSRLPALATSVTTWGSVSATAWLFPRVALLASAGTYPVDYTQGFPGGKFASVGVRIALSRRTADVTASASPLPDVATDDITAFSVATGANGVRTIRVRAPRARSVEIAADFTHWQPRALTTGGDGWYSLSLPIARGTYQMSVRMDAGAWQAPPTLTPVTDEFGGTSGLLVLP